MGAFVVNFVVSVAILLAAVPMTIYGLRFVDNHRKAASAAATLLLLFGIGMRVDPPPPPKVEATEPDQEAAKDDEPK